MNIFGKYLHIPAALLHRYSLLPFSFILLCLTGATRPLAAQTVAVAAGKGNAGFLSVASVKESLPDNTARPAGYPSSGNAMVPQIDTDLQPVKAIMKTTEILSGALIAVSGTVWNDVNGNLSIDPDEKGTNTGGSLWVNLVNISGEIVASASVASNGLYSLMMPVNEKDCRLVLTIYPGGVTPALPDDGTGWINTGESGNGSNMADQLYSPVGEIALRPAAERITCQNFGIEHRPVAWVVAAAEMQYDKAAAAYPVPALGGTDPGDIPVAANVCAIRIQTLPDNGVLYYEGRKVMAGQTFYHYDPDKLRLVPDSAMAASFIYCAVDIAGQESFPETVAMNFQEVQYPQAGELSPDFPEGKTEKALCIYPNPVMDRLYLSGITEHATKVCLIDEQGRIVFYAGNVPDSIDMKSMAPGTYLLQLEQADQPVTGFKLVKQ